MWYATDVLQSTKRLIWYNVYVQAQSWHCTRCIRIVGSLVNAEENPELGYVCGSIGCVHETHLPFKSSMSCATDDLNF